MLCYATPQLSFEHVYNSGSVLALDDLSNLFFSPAMVCTRWDIGNRMFDAAAVHTRERSLPYDRYRARYMCKTPENEHENDIV